MNQEQYDIIKSGVDQWHKYVMHNLNVEADLRGADFTGTDLRGAYLRDVYLNRANLRRAVLIGTDLRGACLRGAYLEGANFEGADLRGADLRGVYICDTNFHNAIIPYRGGAVRVKFETIESQEVK